jgi:mRNA interferase RelE/StbE
MKALRYTADALKDLKRYGSMAARVRAAMTDYAADQAAHSNNVTQLVGATAKRMRVGDFRVIFEETAGDLLVTKIAPRGSVYD